MMEFLWEFAMKYVEAPWFMNYLALMSIRSGYGTLDFVPQSKSN